MMNSLDSVNSFDWNGHQGFITTSDCITSTLEVAQSVFSDLDPTQEEIRVYTGFILGYLALKENLLIRVVQIYEFIVR